MPEVTQQAATLDETFRDTMRQAAECASQDESRYVLNSVFLDVRDPRGPLRGGHQRPGALLGQLL